MRTLGAGCRALALVSLLLATTALAPGAPTHAAAQSRWSGELAAGYGSGLGGDLGGSGSLGLHVAGLYRLGRRFGTGIELGYYRLGTSVTSQPDLYGPGSTFRESFGWSALQATGTLRLYPIEGAWQPYLSVGAGAYGARSRDEIVVTDANGQEIPSLAFLQTRTDLKPGVNAGVGVVRRRALGSLALGVHARWHGILDIGGAASFATLTVGVGLE
jgi:hypothetical protein